MLERSRKMYWRASFDIVDRQDYVVSFVAVPENFNKLAEESISLARKRQYLDKKIEILAI